MISFIFGTQLLIFECFWRLHFAPILTCWMNVFKFKHLTNMRIKSHGFLCNPYHSWEFHDSIKYQCPGETIPNGPNIPNFWKPAIRSEPSAVTILIRPSNGARRRLLSRSPPAPLTPEATLVEPQKGILIELYKEAKSATG